MASTQNTAQEDASTETTLQALQSDPLVQSATSYIRTYMSNYDASHSFDHIQRVVRLAVHIYTSLPPQESRLMDPRAIVLSALLHDVGDKKYLPHPDADPSALVSDFLLAQPGCPPALAAKVQAICTHVSYSTEAADPARTAEAVRQHPELAVVQDADRVDALGAVGLARMFTFGGARRPDRSLQQSMDHVDEKLLRLEAMCKTAPGRAMASERSARLTAFKAWWGEETRFAAGSWDFGAPAV